MEHEFHQLYGRKIPKPEPKKLTKAQVKVIGGYILNLSKRTRCGCSEVYHYSWISGMNRVMFDALVRANRIDERGFLTYATCLEAMNRHRESLKDE